MKPKFGIIGDGNVGTALARKLERAGDEVHTIGKVVAIMKRVTHAW